MTGSKSRVSAGFFDDSRYKSHAEIFVPDKKESILQKDHEYIILWGFWNGTDEMLAHYDGNYFKGVNALEAYRNKNCPC